MYELGQRVRYELHGAGGPYTGEGTIVRLPIASATYPAGERYRVRHDGGTATRYVEVGVLEGEIVAVVEP